MRKNLFNVAAIIQGFKTTLSYAFSKKPTIEYTSVRKQHALRFHGLNELRRYTDGKESCIGCERYEIDELRCIFCGLCEEACPTDAIVLTPRFEMADYRRSAFIYSKESLLVPATAGVGTPPDERPGGIPADLGSVTARKNTVDVETGYDATWRGTLLKKDRKGMAAG